MPQQHAIVKLTRHLVAGWNTLCLPFGATNRNKEYYAGYDDDANARVFVNALRADSSSDNEEGDFMIAVYRGWNEASNLFCFLKYSRYDEKPLPPFETIKVRMGSNDIHSDDIYTFTDVNHKWDSASVPTTYQPEGIAAETFNGDCDLEAQAPFNDGNSNVTDYVFKGTFQRLQGIVGQEYNGYRIPLNAGKDYYYQTDEAGQTHFFTYNEGDKVIVRGFSGWLSYVGTETMEASPKLLSMQVFDEIDNAITDAIPLTDSVDSERTGGFDIYNISGQQVRSNVTSTTGLPKGVYIVEGRKVLVK